MANSKHLLSTRRAESEALLRRAVEMLQADPRVGAAWLTGSLGRGTADDLSDIDLWVVVADKHVAEVSAARREYVARIGTPLLIEEAPQNAPPGGAYLLVLYPGEAGPHQVDWYWQPQSTARVPGEARVLFDQVGVPVTAQPWQLDGPERAHNAAEQVLFFWAMCAIAAKKIARRQPWTAIRMLSIVGQTLDEVKWRVGTSDKQPGYSYEGANPPPTRAADKLALLREMSLEMESLMPRIAATGEAVPSDEAIAQIYRFLQLVEIMIEEGVTPEP